MDLPADLADKIIKIELSLKAYQKLHADELAELWKALDACKKSLVEKHPFVEKQDPFTPAGPESHGES